MQCKNVALKRSVFIKFIDHIYILTNDMQNLMYIVADGILDSISCFSCVSALGTVEKF